MNTKTFNENFVLEDTKKGVRGRAKNGTAPADAFIATGEIFNPENTYFYFCESTKAVRDTRNLRRIDNESLGSFGLRLTRIDKIYSSESGAIDEGQKYYRTEIVEREAAIKNLEKQRVK